MSNVVTTHVHAVYNFPSCDGVSASWHVHTRTKLHVREIRMRYKPIGDQGLRVLVANDIGPGYYGRVGEDCCFVPGPATCVIGIDPGHANIIVAAKRSVNNPTRSKFNLKNTTWRHMNGNHQYLQRVTSQGERHGVPIAASHLARCSSRSLSLYDAHITGRLVTAPVFTNIMRYTKCTSCEEQSTIHAQSACTCKCTDVRNLNRTRKEQHAYNALRVSAFHVSACTCTCS